MRYVGVLGQKHGRICWNDVCDMLVGRVQHEVEEWSEIAI